MRSKKLLPRGQRVWLAGGQCADQKLLAGAGQEIACWRSAGLVSWGGTQSKKLLPRGGGSGQQGVRVQSRSCLHTQSKELPVEVSGWGSVKSGQQGVSVC